MEEALKNAEVRIGVLELQNGNITTELRDAKRDLASKNLAYERNVSEQSGARRAYESALTILAEQLKG